MSIRNSVMREQITAAAGRLFLAKGVGAVSMQEVAKEVELSKAALYHYFDSRNDLLRHLFGEWARKEIESAQLIVDAPTDPASKLTEFIALHIQAIAGDLDLYSLSFREEEQLPDDIREEFQSLKRRSDDQLRTIIREGIQAGIFAPADETLTVFAVMGMCNWLWKWYRPDGDNSPDEIAESFSHLVLHGLLATDSEFTEQAAAGQSAPTAAAAYHARMLRHHSRQLEELLRIMSRESIRPAITEP